MPEGATALLAETATRGLLLEALEDRPRPLFAMTHGQPGRLYAQSGEEALGLEDVPRLSERATLAYACHTAQVLGEAVAASRGTWWGYTGSIAAPDASPEFLPVFATIFAYLREAFPAAQSTDFWISDPDIDVGSALFCLLHIWQRLRVWESGALSPLMHPQAPPPILFP